MSTPFYLIAHHALPTQAASDPAGLWRTLSGSDWSTWLAMIGHQLGESVRGVGVEGVVTGSAVSTRDGVEMLAMYFPQPAGPGEPYYAVLARRAGSTELRSFVFELGIPEPGGPPRVVMAEWRVLADNSIGDKGSKMRIRFDEEPDASHEACLRRTASIMNENPGPRAQAPAAPFVPAPTGPAPRSAGLSVNVVVGLAVLAVLLVGAGVLYLLVSL